MYDWLDSKRETLIPGNIDHQSALKGIMLDWPSKSEWYKSNESKYKSSFVRYSSYKKEG